MKLLKRILAGLAGGLVGGGAALAFLALVPVRTIPAWWWLMFPSAWWLAVGVHEVAHTLVGIQQGFVFNFLLIWPLQWEKIDGRMRVVWKAGFNPGGGLSSLFPDRLTPDLRGRMARFVGAGPASSLALALTALWLFADLREPERATFGAFLWAMVGAVSSLLFIVSAVPVNVGGMMTDGAWLRLLWNGGPAMESNLAFMSLVGIAQARSLRPRDWPQDMVRAAEANDDGTMVALAARLMAYHYALDRGEIDDAGWRLDEVMGKIERVPPPLRNDFYLEQAWFEAAIRRRIEEAQRALDQAKGGPYAELHSRRRAEAALAHLRGDPAEAMARAREGLERIREARSPGIAVWEREVLESYVSS